MHIQRTVVDWRFFTFSAYRECRYNCHKSTGMSRSIEDFAELASDWFWETDENHVFTYFSDRLTDVTGVPKSEYLGLRRDQIALDNISDPKWRNHLEDLNARRPFKNLIYWTKRPTDGSDLCVKISGMPVFFENGEFFGYRGVGTDITQEQLARKELKKSNEALECQNKELEKAKAQLEAIANHDALTNLPNRRYFDEFLAGIEMQAASDEKRVIISADLDNFKYINDKFGHDCGDKVLQYVSREIQKMLLAEDFLARLGGDEFVIVCAKGTDEARASVLAEQIASTFARPVEIDGHLCRFGASVGYIEHAAPTLREGVKRADVALYQAKRSGRGGARRFEERHYAEFSNAKRVADEIAAGIEAGEFEAFFQPQFDAATLDFSGVEALARWRHPTRGLLAPLAFLTIADDYGLLGRLDEQIFEQAIELCRDAHLQGVTIPKCAVNVSLSRLKSDAFLESVERGRGCGATVSFELLETSSFEADAAVVSARLGALRSSGFEIELDDFGSGFASITSLIGIEPHRLKIDRSLIAPAPTSDRHRRLVAAIVELARALEVGVIAEGVETWRHVEVLREIGCDAFQGFFFARPMAASALIEFVKRQTWRGEESLLLQQA